jgi:hypothetical protein
VCRGDAQPDAIVRDTRAHALTVVRQPPVLHVAGRELAAGRTQQVLTGQRRLADCQGHAVLQLVAKSIGAVAW